MELSFYIRNDKLSKKGLVPIYLAVYFGQSRPIRKSTGKSCKPANFDEEKQKVTNKETNAIIINNKLGNIRQAVDNYFTDCAKRDVKPTEAGIYEALQQVLPDITIPDKIAENKEYEPQTLEELAKLYMEKQKGFVSDNYLRKYNTLVFHLEKYSPNTPLLEISIDWLLEFKRYFLDECDIEMNTIRDYFKGIRGLYMFSISFGYKMNKDILNIKIKETETEFVYLSEDEVKQLESYQPTKDYLIRVKDMFLFQCYTGLRHSDMMNLRSYNIKEQKENGLVKYHLGFISQKTKKQCFVPLTPKALTICEKYRDMEETLFHNFTQQKYNVFLKELALLAGLMSEYRHISYQGNKRTEQVFRKHEVISSHVGRHTFATIFILRGGRIEVLSKVLGHGSISVTMKYPKILNMSIEADIHKAMDF
jgi:site-specific recombinase XerD